jgi:hypothetical protein
MSLVNIYYWPYSIHLIIPVFILDSTHMISLVKT